MSSKDQLVAAIDIGTTKIVAIVGRCDGNGGIEILGLSNTPSTGVKRGVVLNIEETVKAIRTTVDDLEDENRYRSHRCLCRYCRKAYKKQDGPWLYHTRFPRDGDRYKRYPQADG